MKVLLATSIVIALAASAQAQADTGVCRISTHDDLKRSLSANRYSVS